VADESRETSDKYAPGPIKRFRYKLEVVCLKGLAWIIQRLSFGGMTRFADGVAIIAWSLLHHDRKVALANVDLAFGDTKSTKEKNRIARLGFRNLCRTLVSLFWAPNLTKANIGRYAFIDDASEARLKSIEASGRGIVFCTPHWGNWELGCLLTGFSGRQLIVVGEPTRNAAVGRLIFELRGVSGHKVVPPQFAVLKLFRQVSRGGGTATLVDVNGRRGRGGAWSEFFGLPVYNSTAPAELALRTGAAIVMSACYMDDTGGPMRLHFEELPVTDTADRAADTQRITDAITRAVETLVRERPEQWLWTYKRWKRRPTEEKGRYPFYSRFQRVD
jgi:KDO2-lipid IV(A) lauroyltransferase